MGFVLKKVYTVRANMEAAEEDKLPEDEVVAQIA